MFDLERAIGAWKKELRPYESFEDGLVAELELQLRDSFDALKREGLGEEDAFRTAADRLGAAETIAVEFRKNRAAALDRRSPLRPSRVFPALTANYLKTAWRKIVRDKGYGVINVAGLAIGMACGMLTMLHVRQELSYDRYHVHSGRIVRLVSAVRGGAYPAIAKVPGPWGLTAQSELPDVEKAVRFVLMNEVLVAHGSDRFYENGGVYADPSVFDVFTFPMVRGNPAAALAQPGTVVVTESFARKYFHGREALGETLTFDAQTEYKVTGVIRDVPAESHFTFDFMVSMTGYMNPLRDDWQWTQFYTYLLLRPGTSPPAVAEKIRGLLGRHMEPAIASQYEPVLQKLTDIHLRSHLFREIRPNSDESGVIIYGAVAALILAIACINFMNLATARASSRAKEVGVRKAAGASRAQLVRQFLAESVVMSAVAFAAALGVMAVLLPGFESLTGHSLTLFDARHTGFLAAMAMLAIAVGLASGVYPAFVLSAYQPADALKGRQGRVRGERLRKGLVVFQFAASALLMIATGIVRSQLAYVQNKPLGFEKDGLVVIPIRDDAMRAQYEMAKRELLGVTGVLGAAASGNLPGGSDWGAPYAPEGIPPDRIPPIREIVVDDDFISVYRLSLAAGRSFSQEHPSDRTAAVLINEEAARQLGWVNPLGRTIAMPVFKRGPSPVIGVLKDFHFRSLHEKIGPLLLLMAQPEWMTVISVRIGPNDIPGTLASLERKWREIDPAHPFTYTFLDERFAGLYEKERRAGRLLLTVAGLAVLVACLGLFGLAAYSAEKRTKEIGVRKAVGASAAGIVLLLAKDFTRLVVIGYLVALPVGFDLMRRWLHGFAYRTGMSLGPFVTAGLAAFAVGWLAVGFQSLRAARANPADSLRYE